LSFPCINWSVPFKLSSKDILPWPGKNTFAAIILLVIIPLELILPEAVIWPDPDTNNEPVITAWAGSFVIASEPA